MTNRTDSEYPRARKTLYSILKESKADPSL